MDLVKIFVVAGNGIVLEGVMVLVLYLRRLKKGRS